MVAKPIPRRMKEFNCKPLMCHDPPHPAPYVIGGGSTSSSVGKEVLPQVMGSKGKCQVLKREKGERA